jgi:hypothetical protein
MPQKAASGSHLCFNRFGKTSGSQEAQNNNPLQRHGILQSTQCIRIYCSIGPSNNLVKEIVSSLLLYREVPGICRNWQPHPSPHSWWATDPRLDVNCSQGNQGSSQDRLILMLRKSCCHPERTTNESILPSLNLLRKHVRSLGQNNLQQNRSRVMRSWWEQSTWPCVLW